MNLGCETFHACDFAASAFRSASDDLTAPVVISSLSMKERRPTRIVSTDLVRSELARQPETGRRLASPEHVVLTMRHSTILGGTQTSRCLYDASLASVKSARVFDRTENAQIDLFGSNRPDGVIIRRAGGANG